VRIQLQLRLTTDDGDVIADTEVIHLDKSEDRLEMLGLSLNETKALLSRVQEQLVTAQAAAYVAGRRRCPLCGCRLQSKGQRRVIFRTAFGNVPLSSPRFYRCGCDPSQTQTFSPLTGLLTEHTAPELLYLETKWASLVSYGMSIDLLKDVLPIAATASAATVRNHLHKVAKRRETELGDERHCFIEGCPADWEELPIPEGPIIVGIDGGYVRSWEDRKNNFEVIVGKSVPEDREHRYFGLVQTHDDKPKRRLFEVLRDQGFQMNQDITFLTDGGDSLRRMISNISPCSEHHLDWFHIAMRFTVLGQFIKGLAHHEPQEAAALEERLARIKWRLWHGDGREALIRLDTLAEDVDALETGYPNRERFAKTAAEFATYIRNNVGSIPNYGERWRNGELISTSFVESTVNVLISKRFCKKQQMQWTPEGAHLLLQTRAQTLDGALRGTFEKWYSGLAANDSSIPATAAAA
jgi:hypothetical protein